MYSRIGFDCEIPIKSRNHSQFVKLKLAWIRPLYMLTWATCQVDTHKKQKCNFFLYVRSITWALYIIPQSYLKYIMVTKNLMHNMPFVLFCISEAILGYNLTEVPQVLNQNTVGIIRHNEIKNQVHWIYTPVSWIALPYIYHKYTISNCYLISMADSWQGKGYTSKGHDCL